MKAFQGPKSLGSNLEWEAGIFIDIPLSGLDHYLVKIFNDANMSTFEELLSGDEEIILHKFMYIISLCF